MSSYMWASSFCVCIVFVRTLMSLSGLHSVIDIWMCESIVGDGMNLVFLVCVGVKCICIKFL